MPQRRSRKWWEGSIFLLILLLVGSLVWAVLSQWKRTPHIYAYDDGVNIEKEKELADAGEQENEAEEEQQTTPPDEQDDDADTHNPDLDNSDSSDKKQGEGSKPGNSEHGTPGGEGSGEGVGDEGGGDGTGDGDGEPVSGSAVPAASPDAGEGAESSPTPVPAAETPGPTKEPEQTPPPKDKVVSLTCTWADKDTLLYKGSIPRDSIKVKATYSSGRQVDLDASDYTISGLNNDSIGTHTMTVIYEDVMCRLNYTVNNYIDHIEYDWPTRMKCYKGEVIDEYVLTVTVYMADNTEYDLKDSQYKITGIDNQKTGVQQTFRITYEGFSVEGTCQFTEQKIVVTDQFYDGQTLQATETNGEASSQIRKEMTISDETGAKVTRNGKEYVLKSIKVVVDGREKSLPYEVDERNFDIQITRRYEEG